MLALMHSTKDTRRRYSRKSSVSKKNTPPSSAISTVSTVSSSSASSNATVTSRSIFPSSLRPSKRPDAKPLPERPTLEHTRSRSTDNSNKENLDVFAFMEDEEDEEYKNEDVIGHDDHHEAAASSSSSSLSSARLADLPQRSPRLADLPQRSPRYSDLEVQDGVQRVWGRESLHSDSGISDMRSSSPDQESPTMQHKLPTLLDVPSAEVDGQDAQYSYAGAYGIQESPDLSGERNSAFRHKHWPSLDTSHGHDPEAYYAQSPARLTNVAHDTGSPMPELYPRHTNQLARRGSREVRTESKPSKSGYELLASNIDSRDDAFLKPIYRKFETLNNRMLLYLQDEISEMEDQLRELDDAIAHDEQAHGEKPASRRAEAKLPSQLQWHRLDLLGRSFAKVEQYNRALASYANLTKSLSPASHADINAYRAWITQHTPITSQESNFLEKGSDLLGITPQSVVSTKTNNSRTGTALETPIVLVAFALLSTIVVFKVVPQIMGRLVISAMVGVASLCTLSPEVMTNLTCVRDWGKAIATYSAIMVVLALVVS